MLPEFTLCFLTFQDEILMLHRQKAPNKGLWNGVGGHIEANESPFNSCLREVQEETAYQLTHLNYAGLLTWQGFEIPTGGLYLFYAEVSDRITIQCNEGVLAWKNQLWAFTSPEVVSNLHIVLPRILAGDPPVDYHFIYQNDQILEYHNRAISKEINIHALY